MPKLVILEPARVRTGVAALCWCCRPEPPEEVLHGVLVRVGGWKKAKKNSPLWSLSKQSAAGHR